MQSSGLKKQALVSAGLGLMVLFLLGTLQSARTEVIKHIPGKTTWQSLAARPDTDRVELTNGRQITIGSLRRLNTMGQQMRAAVPGSNRPPELKFKPNPGSISLQIKTSSDLAAALKRPDSDTVQLPSGRIATVGQIRFVQPWVEKRVGFKLTNLPKPVSQKPSVTGPTVKIDARTDWRDLLKNKPDSTILESPKGALITLGEVKQYMALKTKANLPQKMAPKAAPSLQLQPGLKGGAK